MLRLRKLTRELLEKQSLFTLRELGRVLNLKSPSSKIKEELIDELLFAQDSNEENITNRKFGAPIKTKVDLTEFYEEVVEEVVDKPACTYQEIAVKFPDKIVLRDSMETFEVIGLLEIYPSGFGFIRVMNYEMSTDDAYVSRDLIQEFKLRSGDKIRALAKVANDKEAPAVRRIIEVNGMFPGYFSDRLDFDKLLPCFPDRKFNLHESEDLSLRCIDLFAPIGRGQRGLIVAPPKTGKTTLLKSLAKFIESKHREVDLYVLLIDERPEEVSDFKKCIKSDVVYSTFDQSPEHHVRAAESLINKVKRNVEGGANVVILLDSLTRLARAYNNYLEGSGKTLSGGVDPMALQRTKKLFGAGRNLEDAGSLTIIATALVDTGSRFDDIVYEEFKGTGNMEIHLSRELSEKRIFPAIDVSKSGTRRDDLLLDEKGQKIAVAIRRTLDDKPSSFINVLSAIDQRKNYTDMINGLEKIVGNKL